MILLAIYRFIAIFMLVTSAVIIMQIANILKKPKAKRKVICYFMHKCCLALDIRLKSRGNISNINPTMYICNHSSYLDIFILAALIPAPFAPKSEIEKWPVIGYLSKLAGAVFIQRDRGKTNAQKQKIEKHFASGESLILFPEGTTGDGNKILPFKSSFFSLSSDNGVAVQPIRIEYKTLNGLPLNRHTRPEVCWYGEMDLLPHFWKLLHNQGIGVEIELFDVISGGIYERKELANICEEIIRGKNEQSQQYLTITAS